jgi:hypothetical protein
MRVNKGDKLFRRCPVALFELGKNAGDLSGRRLAHDLLARL